MSLYRFLFIKSHEFALIILFFFLANLSFLGSCSLTRDPTPSPAVEAQSPNHWTSEEL